MSNSQARSHWDPMRFFLPRSQWDLASITAEFHSEIAAKITAKSQRDLIEITARSQRNNISLSLWSLAVISLRSRYIYRPEITAISQQWSHAISWDKNNSIIERAQGMRERRGCKRVQLHLPLLALKLNFTQYPPIIHC